MALRKFLRNAVPLFFLFNSLAASAAYESLVSTVYMPPVPWQLPSLPGMQRFASGWAIVQLWQWRSTAARRGPLHHL